MAYSDKEKNETFIFCEINKLIFSDFLNLKYTGKDEDNIDYINNDETVGLELTFAISKNEIDADIKSKKGELISPYTIDMDNLVKKIQNEINKKEPKLKRRFSLIPSLKIIYLVVSTSDGGLFSDKMDIEELLKYVKRGAFSFNFLILNFSSTIFFIDKCGKLLRKIIKD